MLALSHRTTARGTAGPVVPWPVAGWATVWERPALVELEFSGLSIRGIGRAADVGMGPLRMIASIIAGIKAKSCNWQI